MVVPEAGQVERLSALAEQAPPGRRAAVSVHRDPQRPQRLRLVHRHPHVVLGGRVGPHVADVELLLQGLALVVGHVGHDHLGTRRDQAPDGRLAESAGPAHDHRRAATDLHRHYPLLRAAILVLENSILMNIAMILEMAASGGDRPAVTAGGRSLSAAGLLDLARAAAGRFRGYPAVLYLGANHLAYPVALFGAALAGVPFVPLNYRLAGQQLDGLRARHPGALVLGPADLDGLIDRGRGRRGGALRGPGRRSRRRSALHQRDHRRAQGGRAAAPAPARLRAEHGGVRVGRRRRRGPGRGAARTTWPGWPTC